jgi:hypothetical protein
MEFGSANEAIRRRNYRELVCAAQVARPGPHDALPGARRKPRLTDSAEVPAARPEAEGLTSAHTYRQRVERAFAADLLAPADGIAEILESPPAAATQDELEKVAGHFGVSSMVIDDQVRNRLLAVA